MSQFNVSTSSEKNWQTLHFTSFFHKKFRMFCERLKTSSPTRQTDSCFSMLLIVLPPLLLFELCLRISQIVPFTSSFHLGFKPLKQ